MGTMYFFIFADKAQWNSIFSHPLGILSWRKYWLFEARWSMLRWCIFLNKDYKAKGFIHSFRFDVSSLIKYWQWLKLSDSQSYDGSRHKYLCMVRFSAFVRPLRNDFTLHRSVNYHIFSFFHSALNLTTDMFLPHLKKLDV